MKKLNYMKKIKLLSETMEIKLILTVLVENQVLKVQSSSSRL